MTTTPTDTPNWDVERNDYYNKTLRDHINQTFADHPWIASVAICVAQYWDDEAQDAVHVKVVFSQLDTPDIEHGLANFFTGTSWDDSGRDTINLPAAYELGHYHLLHRPDGRYRGLRWEANGDAIALFASYCKEGAHQDMDRDKAYSVWAVVRRSENGTTEPEVVGVHCRPWLDGVETDW
jgi:hypothetical protein